MARDFLALSVAVCTLATAWCDEQSTFQEQKSQQVVFSKTVESGLFFLNGKHVNGPYRVEATADSISVNGKPLQIEFKSPFRRKGRFVRRGSHEPDTSSGSGNRRNFENRDQSDNHPQADDYWRSHEPQDTAKQRTRSEFRPGAGFLNRRTTHRIIESLQGNQIVLLFEQTSELIVIPDDLEYELCGALLKKFAATERVQTFTGAGPKSPETVELWQEWLQNYSPPKQLVPRLTAIYDEWKQVEDENNREVAAMHRLESYSYPLTLLGMLVGVVALGHLLRWPRKEDELEPGSQTVRAVEIALWLMLGMALIDLTWTVLATQAGVMKEVNPMAEKLVNSPLQLAIFKTFATGVGFGIFYLWRQRRQIQVATWWMCLVCVLVTFRWVIFDSAISP
jgi:hypothetical protein